MNLDVSIDLEQNEDRGMTLPKRLSKLDSHHKRNVGLSAPKLPLLKLDDPGFSMNLDYSGIDMSPNKNDLEHKWGTASSMASHLNPTKLEIGSATLPQARLPQKFFTTKTPIDIHGTSIGDLSPSN